MDDGQMMALAGEGEVAEQVDRVRTWMVKYIGKVLGIPAERFPTAARFDTYGIDSVEAVIMAGVMEEDFGVQVDPMRLFECPSVDAFAASFAADLVAAGA